MIFKRKPRIAVSHLHFTPDPQQAAALERRLADLSYRPKDGFLRDYQQARQITARRSAWEPRER